MSDLNVQKQLKKMLIAALVRTKGNRRRAAIELGVSQSTVTLWVNKFDLADLFPPHLERRLRRLQ